MHNLIELFIEHLQSERNSSANTVSSYTSDLESFSKFVDLDNEITEEHIIQYLAKLNDNNARTATLKRKLSAIRQFFKFLHAEELLTYDPTEFIQQAKHERPLPKVIDEDTVKLLQKSIDYLETEKDRIRANLIIYLLYGSGLRVSELISLTRNSVQNERFIRVIGKGNKERIVPISQHVAPTIEKWLSICDESIWLFPSVNPKKHITRQRVFQILKQITIFSGIDASKISPHVLRHAFATHILNNGANLLSVKKMLGHENITTTEIYTHVSNQKLKRTLEEFHPFGAEEK